MWWSKKSIDANVKNEVVLSNDNSNNNNNNNDNNNTTNENEKKKSGKFMRYFLSTFINIDELDKNTATIPLQSQSQSKSSPPLSSPKTISLDKKGTISTGWFLGMSLASLSGGMLYGVHTVVKKENSKLGDVIKVHSTAFSAASRALLYGTLLCCGGFLGCGAIFISLTGITTFKELGESSRRNFQRIDDTTKQRQRIAAEKKIMQVFTEAQEIDYWKKLYDKTFVKTDNNKTNNN